MLADEYAREALKRDLALEAKFGVTAISLAWGRHRQHTALATGDEDNYFVLWQISERRTLADPRAIPVCRKRSWRFRGAYIGRFGIHGSLGHRKHAIGHI